jgi:hypothetical protein
MRKQNKVHIRADFAHTPVVFRNNCVFMQFHNMLSGSSEFMLIQKNSTTSLKPIVNRVESCQ